MRVKQSENNVVKQFMQSPRRDVTTQRYPGCRSGKRLAEMTRVISRTAGLSVRMVKVILNTGETEVLVTNLYDARVYDLQAMKEVYGLRRGIETGYGHLKEKLQLAQFSGIRQICIEQDFAANLLLPNLQSLTEKQSEPCLHAVNRQRKQQYRVNKNVSTGVLKHRAVRLFLEKQPFDITATKHPITLMALENLFDKHYGICQAWTKIFKSKKTPA
jgi:hypothetical protein